jgi:glycine betaine/proline transport system permease protein
MENIIPKIPLDNWIEVFVNFLTDNFEGIFEIISDGTAIFVGTLVTVLNFIPSIILIALFILLAWRTSGWRVASFTAIGLLLILNLGYWEYTLDTIALVLTAVLISVVVGVPLGIWSARSASVRNMITPVLDFMQTMPAFVYLIPAISFLD